MKRKIDIEELNGFINRNYKSRQDFYKSAGIANSHFYSLLNGSVDVGKRIYKKLKRECEKHGENIETILLPLPICKVDGKDIEEIIITKDDEVLAVITSNQVIEMNGVEVKFVLYL